VDSRRPFQWWLPCSSHGAACDSSAP
jgi:hypothetical protein